MPDELRPPQTDNPRQHYSLSLEEVALQFDAAGLSRTQRTLQRYCASGRLDCLKTETPNGDAYVVEPHSVERAIAELKMIWMGRPTPTPVVVAPTPAPETNTDIARPTAVDRDTSHQEMPTPTAPTMPDTSRYVELLERDNEFLRIQVSRKDEQISNLSQRFGETQTLLGAMQKMLAPLLGQADPFSKREVREPENEGV